MNNKIIIFDFDGVIIDSGQLAAQKTMDEHPGLTHEMQKEMLAGNFHEELEKIAHLKKEMSDEEKQISKDNYTKAKSELQMYPGIVDLLHRLHGLGYILVINTSAYSRNLLPSLEKAKITHLFNFLATVETSKSKVEKFKIIEEKYHQKKEDMLFITDTLGDVREADEAGVPTVATTWGAHDESYFNREPHDNLIKILHTVKDLESFILSY